MTTKQKIIDAANRKSIYSDHPGDFVDTDGAWCMTRTPEQFKAYLEKRFGFVVIECWATSTSTAIAITSDGIQIAWNGFCRRLNFD